MENSEGAKLYICIIPGHYIPLTEEMIGDIMVGFEGDYVTTEIEKRTGRTIEELNERLNK